MFGIDYQLYNQLPNLVAGWRRRHRGHDVGLVLFSEVIYIAFKSVLQLTIATHRINVRQIHLHSLYKTKQIVRKFAMLMDPNES